MSRNARVDVGGEIYHVINRANGRFKIFDEDKDYKLFEQLLLETKELNGMRILAYVIMPNHWHLVLYPKNDGDLGVFMQRLTNAHTRKVHAKTGTNGNGHLYQGRYKSFLVDSENYLLSVIKYVERNPVRAKLVISCEDWEWGSAYFRLARKRKNVELIDLPPINLPIDYKQWINAPEKQDEVDTIRISVNKSVPYGGEGWVEKMVVKHKLESTLKSPGRPKKRI
ncbi:MAG: transposase [Candidatus Pacebacteria bacterium]|jgi:putative transposase|nr:transposase [Candidatus Paceibacterota bacterium]